MSTIERLDESAETTTVDVKATGHVRAALDEHRFEFTFEGATLREFLDAFFEEHGLEGMLIAETDAEAATDGWASAAAPDDLPGDWHRNEEGENTRPFARVLVNGRFNECLDGFDTELSDGDRVALVYPFMFCV